MGWEDLAVNQDLSEDGLEILDASEAILDINGAGIDRRHLWLEWLGLGRLLGKNEGNEDEQEGDLFHCWISLRIIFISVSI